MILLRPAGYDGHVSPTLEASAARGFGDFFPCSVFSVSSVVMMSCLTQLMVHRSAIAGAGCRRTDDPEIDCAL
jgi:hypothetical protein